MATRILSINGNRSMNYLLKTCLSTKYEIITVKDVLEGIYYLKKKEIELILIDLDCDTRENIEFINYIRSSWLYKKPFIVLSCDQKVIYNLAKDIFINIIHKPFNPVELLKMADQLVQTEVSLLA